MSTLIERPTRIAPVGNKPKLIDTLVIQGTLHVEHAQGNLQVHAGQAVHAHAGEWVRYVCLPAFSPDTVRRDPELRG